MNGRCWPLAPLREFGINALFADRCPNPLQIPGELAAMVETWRMSHADPTCRNSLPEIGRSGEQKTDDGEALR